MPLWGNLDLANNAPKHAVISGLGHSNANGVQAYGNTQLSGYISGMSVGVFNANTSKTSNSSIGGDLANKSAHAGWVLRKQGTGPLTQVAIVSPGFGYNIGGGNANGYIVFAGGSGSGANAQWFSNANGAITSVVVLNPGSGYNTAPTASISNTNTAIATFTTVLGGRAGRVHVESLVAMGSTP